ncbi:FAD-dependent monooxygenase [Labrys wisconsinensis]|uniref:2-polyprenyl-6-methoxyphenol hydroxylase-like FAD-dependent oxidoreductase n=1 Tax=Labrys wisconsinensis TaxID=425677 RepID=A0ABU0JKP8_9HYPH|nr:FAD-dependent monooxygenase [Labrys wisconsinensis]MDQ0474858.1 2-polyprenyl-6-methoxyphenol hydroxylase-like FAD-dependent oxidoreductase [Labrys wisconsinensis]
MGDAVTPPAVDVVIAGAGPTGLMAAALLARCGLTLRILDKAAGQAQESRAFGVQARSMELFLSVGLADAFLERGLIASGAQIFVDGRLAAQLDFDDIGRADTPYPFLTMVPQWDVEAILVEDLARLGIAVEHRTEVTGFSQSDEAVAVRATGPDGGAFTVEARYLVGADGAHSLVRKALGADFQGAAYPQGFLLADCKVEWPLDYDHFKAFLHERNFALYLPLRGESFCRIIAIVPAESDPAAAGDPQGIAPATLQEVETAFRAAAGVDVRLSEPKWVSRYRVHHRGASTYGRGRVFIAGDAAHIHSPAGAQGMNTGLQDAANLAWKIAAVARGQAPAALLATYHAERWPVGQKVLEVTDRLFAGVSSQAGWATALRNRLLPLVAGTVFRSGALRARAFHFISQLGIRYHAGEFVADDISAGAPKAWRDGLRAGCRAPNAALGWQRDVFGLIGGYRFHLLALSHQALDAPAIDALCAAIGLAKAAAPFAMEVHLMARSLVGRDPRMVRAESGEVFGTYGLGDGVSQALFLVRPDGYIAYRADGMNFDGLAAFLRRMAPSPI